ncbi:glycosyltransferase family 2 protein [Ligilactobacillus sp. WILCCON 0076]|uniref:Glucans biosynthesis glucosyltransferase H n=1 Tax=Ligilactobacillus ubinensis TaxID=2876789 RepID=A0A9X2FT58_9LACO|nr:glycosyltransferase family 2 protein [Ligilactobacillus ubinensis]MCP0888063.1 glycosyltransferase family 2 protein [Ligilactobacillus ubinensis]
MKNKTNMQKLFFKKNPATYTWILFFWSVTMCIFEYFAIKYSILPTYTNRHFFFVFLLILNQLFVAIFFFCGISNLVIAAKYQFIKKKEQQQELAILKQPLPKRWHPRVQLLYTTYNDFIPYAFAQCLNQTYDNVQGVILDNSTDEKYIKMIQQFVKVHPQVKWVRNAPNKHAKAGNLNSYLCKQPKESYDYFVILDSDELLENKFVEKCLKFFYHNHHLGILQCNHISGQNYNSFMNLFSNSGNIFWPVQNVIRSVESGTLAPNKNDQQPHIIERGSTVCIELGHGVMISRECFEDIGQIPHAVAEDLCTSVEALLKGWNIRFASQIYGNEEFPVDMSALMVRSSKFCSANFEFFRNYFKTLKKTKLLTFYQKLDLLSFTLSVPMNAFQYISLLLSSIIFPLSNIKLGYQLLMLFPVLVCYFSQGIIDGFFELQRGMKFHKMLLYEIQIAFLYGSFYYLTVKSTFFALLKRPAKFNVTPKKTKHITLTDAFKKNWQGIVFSLLTIVFSIICSGCSWILLSFLPGCLGFIFELKANQQGKQDQQKLKRFEKYNYYALYEPKHEPLKWNE